MIIGRTTTKKVSAMDFCVFRIMIRTGSANHIFKCRQLFHQFIVDMYAKVESERLLFIRLKPKEALSRPVYSFTGCCGCGERWKCGRHVYITGYIHRKSKTCMNMLKMLWHMFELMGIPISSLHSHVIQLRMNIKKSFWLFRHVLIGMIWPQEFLNWRWLTSWM